jgi:hypothetical protein
LQRGAATPPALQHQQIRHPRPVPGAAAARGSSTMPVATTLPSEMLGLEQSAVRRPAVHALLAPEAMRRLWQLVRDSVAAWIDDYAPSMDAALAYCALFSIAPLLVSVIPIAGFVFGAEAALVTALLFTIGKFLIGLYLGKSGVTSGFGAAGSMVVLLIWVYYSAQIFLLGAEFTWVYAHRRRPRTGVPAGRPGAASAAPALS